MQDDAQVLIGAGTETTGATLAVTTVYVLADPDVHMKLFDELREAIPDPNNIPDLAVLEKLPYLVSFVPRNNWRTSY